ncbi:MAG: Hsp33 family molecular chaperone HslO [Proteobacteria bacterium]|nr:Hsp33 family molecular chaperone HslO [Pseudomonadota bacterium]
MQSETGEDQVLAFTIPGRDARGRLVRLGPVLRKVLEAHAYPAPIRDLLAEALVLTALLGALLKDPTGQLTMQAQTEQGIVDLLVCDYRDGELRGYVRHDADRLAMLGARPSLFALFGQGYLAITFDLAATGQRYQGIVPLEGDSLAAACQAYFVQSEQVPTLIRVTVGEGRDGLHAGALLVQHLPDGEEGRERLHARLDHPEWEHVAALAGSITPRELLQDDLTLEGLVWRLFHEEAEVRIEQGPALTKGCRCTAEYYRSVLARFPAEDLESMRDEQGQIVVDCAFCSKLFPIAI